jgi:hypothetical protein
LSRVVMKSATVVITNVQMVVVRVLTALPPCC